MLSSIASPQELAREAAIIQAVLDTTPSDEIEEIVDRGNDLIVYIARTGKMRADAEYHRDELLKSEIMKVVVEEVAGKLPATTVNKLLDAVCKEANYLCTWIERLNRTSTHQLDWCRTLISKAKAEYTNSRPIN
jgi:hypothetical protein